VSAACSAGGAGVGRRSSPRPVIRSSPYTYQGGRDASRYHESIRFLARLFAHDDSRSWRFDLCAGAGARQVAGSREVLSFETDVLRTARRSIAMKSNHAEAHGGRVGRVDAGHEVPRTWKRAPTKWSAICAAICSSERGAREIQDLRFVPLDSIAALTVRTRAGRPPTARIRCRRRSSPRPGMGRDAVRAFGERFIAHIEAQHLAFGGGIGPRVGGFATRFRLGSATAYDRASVIPFLTNDPDVTHHRIGDLRDALVRVAASNSIKNRRST
jgi:hypothetical protein